MSVLFYYFFKLPQKIRFILVGGFNTIVSFSLFALLYWLLKENLHYLLILVSSSVISISFAYLMLRFFVFRSQGDFFKELAKCYITYLSVVAINSFLLYSLVDLAGMKVLISQFFSAIIMAIVSYLGHKNYSFRK